MLDVKPWDDETDLAALEQAVRSIEADGLIWGQCKFSGLLYFHVIFILLKYFSCVAKLMPVAFGVKKLQIGCVVEDDKVILVFYSHFVFEPLVYIIHSRLEPIFLKKKFANSKTTSNRLMLSHSIKSNE